MSEVDPKDYHYAGYNGTPFTDEQLAIVPDEIKAVLIRQAQRRFPAAHKLAANAMIGAVALLLSANGKVNGDE
jgi:hypothetical protein